MVKSGPTIYVVDDDASVRRALSRLLKSAGFQVETFMSAQEFLDSGQTEGPGLLVLDVRLPGLSGLALQKVLSASVSRLPIIFITAFDNDQERAQGLSAGALAYLRKPFQEHQLLEAIEAGLHHAERASEWQDG
jgi:FixJ family two-component response regulator